MKDIFHVSSNIYVRISCDYCCAGFHVAHIPKGNLLFYFYKKKTSAVSTTDGWLKLNFARYVIRQIRSSGALVLYSICNMVIVH